MLKQRLGLGNERGSITLEAAIAFPVFLLFIVFMIGFIRLAYIQMSLDLAVGDATKEIATHYYPIGLVKSLVDDEVNKANDTLKSKLTDNDFGKLLPSFIKEAVTKSMDEGLDNAKTEVGKIVDEALKEPAGTLILELQQDGDKGLLKKENLSVKELKVAEGDDIIIDVTYKVKIPSPLGAKTIVLESRGVEKAWK